MRGGVIFMAYFDNGRAVLHCGDALATLIHMEPGTVQACVTSPPYWGLRDYNSAGQLGMEPTWQEYVARLMGVMREVKRVLADDGVLWLNLGDTYEDRELLGLPWRMAFAMKDAGWWLRSECIWHKPNAMPESVKNRPTRAHEHLFMFTKSDSYLYWPEDAREPAVQAGRVRADRIGGNKYGAGVKHSDGSIFTGSDSRNIRTVWSVPTTPLKGSHVAPMPPALVERCLRPSTRSGDVVLDPFSGSGTTGLVALKLGRRFVGVELNESYACFSVARWRQQPGELALATDMEPVVSAREEEGA